MRRRRNPTYSEADLARALAGDKDLVGANLEGADLRGARLHGANLEGANLEGANLEGADLTWANLEGANLEGANLAGANLAGAHRVGADLTRARLQKADLRGANLEGADLREANLAGANLAGANLQEANLREANLQETNLESADLVRAELAKANLRGADLRGADIQRADLFGANLSGANLSGANLETAELRCSNLEGANLEDANLENANLENANIAGTLLDVRPVTRPSRAYGKQTGAVLKMGKPDAPTRAADFKKRYPAEFERLKGDTQGRDFTDAVRGGIRQRYETPFEWLITEGRYRYDAQRYCPDPNLVLKFNLDLLDPALSERQRDFLTRLSETSRQSGHPHEKGELFTVGWVRICTNDAKQTWLVEEVQSDVSVVREKMKYGSAPRGFEKYADVIGTMRPYIDRFYEDALGIVLVEAEKRGYAVEMLTYEAKREFGSPKSVYTDLPKAMGMQKRRKSTVLPSLSETWYYKPNPRRRAPARRRKR